MVLRVIWAQARGALSWLIAVLALLAMSASACSGGSDGPPSSTAPSTSGSRASPVSPYGPFPYANGLQEQAFDAYLQCAAEQGVVLRGPFAPSNGKGVLFGPVPGKEITHADQAKVGKHCPQLVVGLFATPGDALHAKLFEQSATEFARCMRSHGFSDLPLPKFAPDDPYKALEGLPFEWGNPRFTAALTRCIDPLRGYVFSG